jgi:hypothetical protein
MSTITDWVTASEARVTADSLNKAYVLSNRISFADVPAGASDTVQCLAVPANTMVLDVFIRIVHPEDGTSTCSVGDGSGTNSWDASVTLGTGATAGDLTRATVGTDAYAASTARGKVYTSADTIDIVLSANAVDHGIFDIFAICFDLN